MKLITRKITIEITSTEQHIQNDFSHVMDEIKDGKYVGSNSRVDAKYNFEVRDELGNLSNLDSW